MDESNVTNLTAATSEPEPQEEASSALPIIKWGKDTPITHIDWLWKPFIPYSKISIVQGDGGDGKTTMILDIAARLSKGIQPPALENGELHELPPTAPITTFYLTNEDEIADSSLVRFKRAGGDDSRFAYSAELSHHMTLTEEELMSAIDQTGAKLVIIDPFQAFLPKGSSMNSIGNMRTVTTALSNVAKETGAAIVLVGHLNKNEHSKDIHRGLGSVDLSNAARSIVTVYSGKFNIQRRFMRATKSNFDEGDMKTVLEIVMDKDKRLSYRVDEDETNGFLGGDRSGNNSSPQQSDIDKAMDILELLLANGPMYVAKIHEHMAEHEISPKTAQRARARLGAEQTYIDGKPAWKLVSPLEDESSPTDDSPMEGAAETNTAADVVFDRETGEILN